MDGIERAQVGGGDEGGTREVRPVERHDVDGAEHCARPIHKGRVHPAHGAKHLSLAQVARDQPRLGLFLPAVHGSRVRLDRHQFHQRR